MLGCASAKYQLTAEAKPPVAINVAKAQPPVEALLHAVIIQRGPGSWKREAFWDEYVLSLANRGATPLTVESATVIDFLGLAVAPSEDPWAVESVSHQWLKEAEAKDIGRSIALGAASVASAYAVMAGTIGAASAELYGPSVVAGLTLWALPLTLPVYAMAGTAANLSGKEKVEREFSRRRLVLPASIAPGQLAQGSLFFRIAPGPQRLVLRCSTNGQLHVVVLDLAAALAGLHLKQEAATNPILPPAGNPPPGSS